MPAVVLHYRRRFVNVAQEGVSKAVAETEKRKKAEWLSEEV